MPEPGRLAEPRAELSDAKSRVLTGLAVVAVAVHLFGLYRPTGPPSLSWFPQVDKLEHVTGFAAPVWLILLARRAWLGGAAPSRRLQLLVVGVFALHAVVSELIQRTYTSRTGDVRDALADGLGVLLGWGLTRIGGGPRRPVAGADARIKAGGAG